MNGKYEYADRAGTVGEAIDSSAEHSPDKPFLISSDTGRSLTYSALQKAVRQIAAWVAGKGVKPGESVGYAMSNGEDTVLFLLGCLYGGYRLTAVNLVAGDSAIAYVLEHSGCRLVVGNHGNTGMISKLISRENLNVPCMDFTEVVEQALTTDQTRLEQRLTLKPEGDGLLMYTSGTTGRPKGVLLSQSNLLCGGYATAQAHQLSQSDVAYCTLPLYHINAFCVSLLATLVSGSTLVLSPKFSTGSFWADIAQYRCTWFSLVPTQISYLLHHQKSAGFDASKASSVRFGRSASAPLAVETKRMFEKSFGMPIIETMGLTETAAQILSNPLERKLHKDGSPGIAFENSVKIGDEQQNELPRGEIGEVLVKGGNVMKGYYKNPEETQKALVDGWLRTGDLGMMDADGYVFITGRSKELIIKGGENIAPREIDEVLYQHADVVEAAAFACPCENYGQTPEACVKIRDGASVSEDALLLLCKEKLGAFKAPRKIHFLPELPKGPSGKIQRLKLYEHLYS